MSCSKWELKIASFLHDPPDKALVLGRVSHEERRDALLNQLGIDRSLCLKRCVVDSDHIASAMQRIDLPGKLRNFHIYFSDQWKPIFIHTLSGERLHFRDIVKCIEDFGYRVAIGKYGFQFSRNFLRYLNLTGLNAWKHKFFILWRFLPELYWQAYFLSADTRVPDHGTWDHLDVASAICGLSGNLALLAVKIVGVQEFISRSRKLSDLWAASHIFSVLCFAGIKVVVDELGPSNVIFPQIRGNPMLDVEDFGGFSLLDDGEQLGILNGEAVRDRLRIASIPNVFLCFVPSSDCDRICDKIVKAIKEKWKCIAEKTREILRGKYGIEVDENVWDSQIGSAIEVVCAYYQLPKNHSDFNNIKGDLPRDLRETMEIWLQHTTSVNEGNFYHLSYQILSAILAQKSRLWSTWEERPLRNARKCLMCGRRNALVWRDGDEYRVWRNGRWESISKSISEKHFLKEKERLCAVCLVKRLYREVFEKLFNAHPSEFESVVEIAARDFLQMLDDVTKGTLKLVDIELVYKHEWDSEEKRKSSIRKLKDLGCIESVRNELEQKWNKISPRKYYAILAMDGDEIGRLLSGEKLPPFRNFLHPAFVEEIERVNAPIRNLLNRSRVLTPSHHIAISRAMKDFSLNRVPEIVERYEGMLVYSGGDDVLALFPVDKVLEAAYEIQRAFREDFYERDGRIYMGLGNKATMSAGIVFAHYKWPLYDALERARKALKRAKDKYGRNAFCATFIKRSGEILVSGGRWNYVNGLMRLARAVTDEGKISHGFIHDFLSLCGILSDSPIEMIVAESCRILSRRRTSAATDNDVNELSNVLRELISEYHESEVFKVSDLGVMLKILYDAYRGD